MGVVAMDKMGVDLVVVRTRMTCLEVARGAHCILKYDLAVDLKGPYTLAWMTKMHRSTVVG